jgi:hypothetical protein
MEQTVRFGIGERLGAIGVIVGVAGVVVSVTYPLAYPESGISVETWRLVFWISALVFSASVLFFICDLIFLTLRRSGIKLGTALTIIGTFLIALGGIIGMIGAFKMDAKPEAPSERKTPNPYAKFTNSELVQKVELFASQLRTFESDYDRKNANIIAQSQPRFPVIGKDQIENAQRLFKKAQDERQELDRQKKVDYQNRFQSDAILLLQELSRRLGMSDNDHPRILLFTIQNAFLSGISPVANIANYLEQLAKRLP